MILSKKDIIDKPRWRPIASPAAATGTIQVAGNDIASDLRGRRYADPYKYLVHGASAFYRYNPISDSWGDLVGLAVAGTYGRGSCNEYAGSQGPRGTLAAGATTTKITLTTALPAAVGVNQLANRGDGLGYIIRIIGNAAGSAGKVEERRVVANTSGTTPVIYLDQPLSFTPILGDAYEFLSGRIYFMNTGAVAGGMFKYYDVLTGSVSGSLATTNLPTVSSVRNTLIPLDEQRVPSGRYPGEGFLSGASTYDTAATAEDFTKRCLLATGTAAASLTGQAASGDANVLQHEYRNFQIRIVEDTAIPTAVGQRRRIAQHTAGPSPVYTLSTSWTVTPSATCKYVIENDTDKLLFFNSGGTTVYNYNHTANTWDTTTWAARSVAHTDAFAYQCFGLDVEAARANGTDPDKNQRNSFIISPRGSNVATYDVFDIAGAATGSWTSGLTIPEILGSPFFQSSTTLYGQWVYDPIGFGGRYVYIMNTIASAALPQILRFDLRTRKIIPYSIFPAVSGSFSTHGNRSMFYCLWDDTNPVTFLAFGRQGGGSTATNDYYELMLV